MDKYASLLNEAGIPFAVRDITLEEDGAPQELIPVVDGLAGGHGEFYSGMVLSATQIDNPNRVIQAFAVVAKEVVLRSMDGLYITPLQLIAILSGTPNKNRNDPWDVDHLFVDTMFQDNESCPYSLREIALMREFFQHRKFNDQATSILSFGPWSRASQWYDRVFVNLFRDHAEVSF